MIRIDQMCFGYGGRETLSDISATIEPGSFHFLTGPSGAGKTTLMRLLYLELRPTGGGFEIFGDNPEQLSQAALLRLRRRIGIVFQDCRLIDHISVADNIALPLRVTGRRVAEHESDIAELISWVGLERRANAFPPELSAGEKQRAAIARAVVNAPDIVLADEPTGNIDPEMGARILKLLIELNRLGRTIILATHDLGMIRMVKGQVSARILRLSNGHLAQGAAEL